MYSSPSLSRASSPDARDGDIPYRSAWSHSRIEAVGLLIYLDDRVQLDMLSHTDSPHIDLFGWSRISHWRQASRCPLLGSDGGETAGLS
mgnify:CR=1 FL=1